MKTLFLETNAINSCFYKGYSSSDFKKILSTKSFLPIISQHTTYELIRNFTSEKNISLGVSLFKIIHELNPTFTCQTSTLIKRELKKLADGTAYDYLIEPNLQKAFSNAIEQICKGNIHPEYIENLRKRELEIKKDQSLWKPLFDCPINSTFEDFYIGIVRDINNISLFINELYQTELDNIVSQRLTREIDNFKVIRTAIRANLYLSFIARKNRTAPALDKTDDFRHLIDASICTYFVTNDNNLKKYAELFNPELNVITFNQLTEIL